MKPKAYLQLFRLPNVFTALADIGLGYWLTHEGLGDWAVLALLACASGLLYTAGMVLNDVFDLEADAQSRPERPLPSGRIDPVWARWLGLELLLSGIVLGCLAGYLAGTIRPGITAAALAGMVLLYDYVLKRTPVAPLAMGACRTLNVLLGASAGAIAWHTMHVVIALGVGLYIVGVTWFARTEASTSHRPPLTAALATMLAGIAMLALYPHWSNDALPDWAQPVYAENLPDRWQLLWLVLGVLIGWRCVWAILDPQPFRVQYAVRQGILSLVLLDAAACLGVRGTEAAVMILFLILPAMFLGRWIYST
ncbi:MAG: UbiA family prenyltransferase [Pirellulales bacterium]|nr:UbiA family prenyltransferase [Pirellulales bacterium]